ncbi:Histone-lysine N-methyltransferase setd3 [Physocladia obscura]|uniref:Histone-lysine N-methyltransferase setd3 n=1 Tax=Physocladia obscura TaxID=109957 RepID=A0AAD5XFY9_9FUNG|nr:Histone-lysine N-methyltransferase setd3 [Physocladia obscura]
MASKYKSKKQQPNVIDTSPAKTEKISLKTVAVVVGIIAVAIAVTINSDFLERKKSVETGPNESITRFVAWMKQGNLIHDGTVVRELQTIHDSLAKTDPIISDFLKKYPDTEWVPIIAAYVLVHRKDPKWEPYLSFLPINHTTPLYWTEDELKVIAATDLSFDLTQMREDIQTQWMRWKNHLSDSLTFEDFLWAWHVVMSRVWLLPVGEQTNKAVMIPMVDVANHYGKPKVKIEYSKELGAVTMTATKPIQAGDQIDVTYGQDSSYKSLKYMGFTIPNNDHNEDCRVQLFRRPKIDVNYHREKRWCLFQTHKLKKTILNCHLGKPQEKETLEYVRDQVAKKFKTYRSSIKTDNEILNSVTKDTPVNFVNGVRERRG